MNKFICFIHIEKCAGTTMHHILHQNFLNYFALSPDRIDYPDMSAQQLNKFIDACKVKVKGIGGHMVVPYMDYKQIISSPIFYFTFFRDPNKRYISYLNHRINRMNFDWSLEEYLEKSQFFNFQTKKIAGEENLQKAIDIIESKVDFVGFMDKFDESLLLLKNQMGLEKFDINYEKSNVLIVKKIKHDFNQLSDGQKSQVIERNSIDRQLYDYVKQNIYPKYIASYKGDLQKDLTDHLHKNEAHRFSKLRLNIDKAKNYTIRKLIFRKKIFH